MDLTGVEADNTMDETNQILLPSNPSASEDLAALLEEFVQCHEILGDIVEKLETDSEPKCCSTPDTTRKTTPRESFSSSTPNDKISQASRQLNAKILNRNEAKNQSSGVGTNEEITECINFVCVLISGIMGFGVFIVFLKFVPKSNLTAALSVVGACMLLVIIFGFVKTLARYKTPLNRR